MKPIRIELPTEFNVGSVNAYLFCQPEPVLVDCGVGTDAAWTALKAALAANGLTVADLARLVISHPHVDHYGLAGRIAAASRAEIWISELGVSWLTDSADMWRRRIAYYQDDFLPKTGLPDVMVEMVLNYMRTTSQIADSIPPDRVHTFPVNGEVQLGGLPWRVLHTPGHAGHLTCFYQPETRQFLAADMLLAKAPTPVVERPLSGTERIPSLPLFLKSLDLVAALDIDVVYPGHGEPFTNYQEIIQQQRERIFRRKEECLEWVKQGYNTAVALIQQMYSDRPLQIQFAGLWMLIGYLDLLIADGRVSAHEIDGVIQYRARGKGERKELELEPE